MASEEHARGRINWRHVNFGGGARTGDVEARASRLEQGVRVSVTEPFFFQRGLSLRLSGSSWWADEPVYESRSSGGRVTISKEFSRAGFTTVRGVRNVASASFIQEYEDYVVNPSVLADPTFRDELIALGLNPETGRGKGTCHGVRGRLPADHVVPAARSAAGILRVGPRRKSRSVASGHV